MSEDGVNRLLALAQLFYQVKTNMKENERLMREQGQKLHKVIVQFNCHACA